MAAGDFYAVDLRTGAGSVLIQGPGTPAVGLDYDRRSGYLSVSGVGNGDGRVYDTANGTPVATLACGGGTVNDVIVTRDAAYFTDSRLPFLYKVALGPAGALAGPFSTLPLSGEFVPVPGEFNTNGIVATPDGARLIIVPSFRGELYLVDPMSGIAELIELSGSDASRGEPGADRPHPLRGAELRQPDRQIPAERRLPISHPGEDHRRFRLRYSHHGAWLYAVNARFGTAGNPATASYDIVKVKR